MPLRRDGGMQVGQGMSGCWRPSCLGALLCGAGSTSGVRGCCLPFTSAGWAQPPEFLTCFWLQVVECAVPVSLGVPYPEELRSQIGERLPRKGCAAVCSSRSSGASGTAGAVACAVLWTRRPTVAAFGANPVRRFLTSWVCAIWASLTIFRRIPFAGDLWEQGCQATRSKLLDEFVGGCGAPRLEIVAVGAELGRRMTN